MKDLEHQAMMKEIAANDEWQRSEIRKLNVTADDVETSLKAIVHEALERFYAITQKYLSSSSQKAEHHPT